MIALPAAFLPFDAARDGKESDEDDEEESSPESDEDSSEPKLNASITNGDANHQAKAPRHIGGGVVLVRPISSQN